MSKNKSGIVEKNSSTLCPPARLEPMVVSATSIALWSEHLFARTAAKNELSDVIG